MVYVDELIGDAAQLGILVGFYQQIIGIATERELSLQTADSAILTNRLLDKIYLLPNEASFKLFKDLVDNQVKNAIIDIYGNFSEFTAPITSQSMLRIWRMCSDKCSLCNTIHIAPCLEIQQRSQITPTSVMLEGAKSSFGIDMPSLNSFLIQGFVTVITSFGL